MFPLSKTGKNIKEIKFTYNLYMVYSKFCKVSELSINEQKIARKSYLKSYMKKIKRGSLTKQQELTINE
jgi:uncharacterized protein YnzC (UPF0291/DUF896 family)